MNKFSDISDMSDFQIILCFVEERLQSHREIKVEYEIRGITVMESKIYVICSDVTDLVFVYDVLTSEPSQIKVARMRSPVGIVACCVCRCLYITDDISKCVFRVMLANNKVDKFLDVFPSDLCVVHNKQISGNGCLLLINDSIELHNTDGECVNVTVMESMYSPMLHKNIKQVCADSKGNFIVSNESDKFSRLLKLAKDGKTLLKTFGGRCGHGKGQLWKSFKILVDSRLEQILIVDRGNNRLILVDSELCLIGQIKFGERQINFDELDQIGYCSDDKKIVIGGHGRLLIFDFSQVNNNFSFIF